MNPSTTIPAESGSILQRWSILTGRRRWILIFVSAIVAGVLLVIAYQWWTSWPYRLLLPSPDGTPPIAFTPDGSTLATSSIKDGSISLWDVKTGEKRTSWISPDYRKRSVGDFSEDGRTFACFISATATEICKTELIDVATGKRRALIDSTRVGSQGRRFLDDGQTLRLVAFDKVAREVVDVDLATGVSKTPRLLTAPMAYSIWSISRNGRWMALGGSVRGIGVNSLKVWDLDLDREVWAWTDPQGTPFFCGMTLSADGKTLAIGRHDGSIEVRDITTSTLLKTIQAHSSDFQPVLLWISPDGSKLASWGIFSRPGVSLDSARFLIKRITGSPKSDIHELVVFDLNSGQRLGQSSTEGARPVFSNDGQTLATPSDAGTLIRDLPASR